MLIGVNIDGQFINMTGIQHYTDSLIGALYGLKEPHSISAFAGHLPTQHALDDALVRNPGTFTWRSLPCATIDVSNEPPTLIPKNFQRDHVWMTAKIRSHESRALARLSKGPAHRSRKYDVLHSTEAFDMRLKSYRPKHSVATILDLATRVIPQTFGRTVNLGYWDQYYDWARDRCSAIVAISESTKRDAIEHLKIPAERIFVTPLAGRSSTRRIEDSSERRSILSKWKLESQPFILYAGTLEPRKNLERLVKAFARLRHENPSIEHKLVLAGGNWERLDLELRLLACENGIGGRVLTTGYVTNEELNALMSACDAFAYVSLYEGFGMPPLEAMMCGAPVVASNVSSLPEVIGDAGILVPPKDELAIAGALHLLITDSAENARRRKLSVKRAAEFNWERTARLTMRAYEAAVA